MRTFLSSFGLVFVAELPDKTALASLALATRLRPIAVIAGAWLAFLVQTAVACLAGGLLTLLPERPVRVAAGLGFLVFAVLAWRRDEGAAAADEEAVAAGAVRRRRAAWLTSFLVIFAAEWGDLTQLATAALVAQTHRPLEVGAGALLALWTVTVLAVVVGAAAGSRLGDRTLQRLGAGLFTAVGVVVLVGAARG